MSLRFAPSPTGFVHIGTARTAYFNWLVAKATGDRFILRIDDTDGARNDDQYVQVILDTMDWLGLDYDQVHYQSKRSWFYTRVADEMLDSGDAHRADNGAVLLSGDKSHVSGWTDTIAGRITCTDSDTGSIRDLVLLKADGSPVYNFCSVVDDYLMGVSHVIRGVDHISNTPKQIAIYQAYLKTRGSSCSFDDLDVKFTHIGLIHDMTGKKLSKRTGAKNVLDYRDDGIKPGAMLNTLLRLGWSPKDANFDSKHKTVTKDMAIDMIMNDGNFRSAPSKFDPAKLLWYNKKY